MADKYFQIGFARCGTRSIAQFLNRNGIRCVHYDAGKLGRAICRNLQERRYILTGYEKYDAFANMMFITPTEYFDGGGHWREFLEQVADAKFILNTRDRGNWIRSRLAFFGSLKNYKSSHRLATDREVVEAWKLEWDIRHEEVQRTIPSRQLLVFDIERDPAERLCEFTGLDAAAVKHWRHEHANMNAFGESLRRWLPKPMLSAVPLELKRQVRWLLRKRPPAPMSSQPNRLHHRH